jgi:hypothetical protein
LRAILLAVLALAQLPPLQQAIALGRTNDDAQLIAFHRRYQLTPGPTINHAEIITEFRRAVMIVQDRMAHAQPAFSEYDLTKEMVPFDGQVTFIVEARLNPMNNYVKAPPYILYVETGKATGPLPPKPFTYDGVKAFGAIGPGGPLVAVRLEGGFPRAGIAAAAAPTLVVVDDHANVVWRMPIDLTPYR